MAETAPSGAPPSGPSLPALTVYFQPILDTVTGNKLGFEALTRLAAAPDRGSPQVLLENARRHGSLRWRNELFLNERRGPFAAEP